MIVAVMMALLQAMSIATSQGLTKIPGLSEQWLDHGHYLLIAVACFISLWLIRLQNKLAILSLNLANDRSSLIGLRSRSRYRVLLAIGMAILLLTSATMAALVQYRAHLRGIQQPIRIQAWVTVEGLSDSHFQPSAEKGYRQLVRIDHWQPLTAPVGSLFTSRRLPINDFSRDSDFSYSSKSLPTKTQGAANQPPKHNADTKSLVNNPWYSDSSDGLSDSTSVTIAEPMTTQLTGLKVLISAYPNANPKANEKWAQLNQLRPNQRVQMALALAPIQWQAASQATGQFDRYRWLRSRHIDATGRVLAVAADDNDDVAASKITQWRWQLRQYFLSDWEQLSRVEQQARAVTLSLLTGDRALIDQLTTQFYQQAGISHLLAISGSHVLLLAVLLSSLICLLVDKLQPKLYLPLPRWLLRWGVMVVTAFVYAIFTGFDVPAARTAWMLVAMGLVRLSLLPVSGLQVLAALALLMAWQDPFVLWQAGYWLSFVAVALLMVYEQNSQQPKPEQILPFNFTIQQSRLLTASLLRSMGFWIWRALRQLLKVQVWIFVALLPLSLLLFGKVSLWGLLINLFAIGLYGMVIVPLNLLAGLSYIVAPTLADTIWQWVIAIVAATHKAIEQVLQLPIFGHAQQAWLYTPVTPSILVVVAVALLPWLLTRGTLSRWLSLPAISLLALLVTVTPSSNRQHKEALSVYLLSSEYPFFNIVLLKDQIEQRHWLLLADFRAIESIDYVNFSVTKLSDRLQYQLALLNVDSLHGVVIQTGLNQSQPASQSNTLAAVVNSLADKMPIGYYWQAGVNNTSVEAATMTTQAPSASATLPQTGCHYGQHWQSASTAFSITAVTGWPDVASAVADCALLIRSDLPIELYRINPGAAQAPTRLASSLLSEDFSATTNNDQHPMSSFTAANPIQQSAGQSMGSTGLLINAARHRHLWQLWHKLCSTEGFATDSWQRLASNSMLLSHRQAQLTADISQRLQLWQRFNERGETLQQDENAN